VQKLTLVRGGVAAVSGISAAAAVLTVGFGYSPGKWLESTLSESSAAVQIQSAAADSGYTEQQATQHAAAHADAQLSRSLGSEKVDSERPEFSRPPIRVDGHVISIADLELTSIRLEANSVAARVDDASFAGSETRDVWVAEFRLDRVSAPHWGEGASGSVRVIVIIEDGTGELKDSSVSLRRMG
jgi:hypothetical protein